MQTCKLFTAVSAAILLAAFVTPRTFAQDSDPQQKAREALRQKMAELDAAKGGTSAPKTVTPPPVTQPTKAAETPAPAEVVTPPPPAQPAPTPPPVEAPKEVTPPPAAPVAVPAAAPTAPADADNTEKARAALRQKMDELNAQPASATAATTAARPTTKAAPGTATPPNQVARAVPATPRALETPAPALSASKEARLAELLRKYKADAITPEEYHTQRAAIRAEP